MYKRILVAVDGSKISNLALKEAIRIAKDQRAALRLIHVVDVMPVYTTMGEIPYSIDAYQKSMRDAGRKVLADSTAKARAGRVKFGTKFVVIAGFTTRIWDVINKDAKRWRADLIVIGTHGRRGFNRLFLGSVAEGVIRLAEKPILVIHGR
jgi:nucleotide-binding universal stress UspA family protein